MDTATGFMEALLVHKSRAEELLELLSALGASDRRQIEIVREKFREFRDALKHDSKLLRTYRGDDYRVKTANYRIGKASALLTVKVFSIPLKSGWHSEISNAYYELKFALDDIANLNQKKSPKLK